MHSNTVTITADHVRELFAKESTGHDWWHTYRVWKVALVLASQEGANQEIVSLAALLHDIADFKFHDGDESVGPRRAREWLESLRAGEEIIESVCDIVSRVSYKGAGVSDDMPTIEGRVVQDADRLDALGAIGIARVFAYGGSKKRMIYDPEEAPTIHESAEAYKNNTSSSLAHFHEKLFLLKDRMHTASGRRLAEERHEYMQEYVRRFLCEWEADV